MLMYRKDLTDKAGVTFAERPTWDQVRDAAAKIHDPKAGVYGICLRGKPGWGDNMAFITTMVNSFGGQWFDMSWKPQLETKPWHDAITFYVDLLKKYGPPGLEREQLQRDPRALQRRQVRHVDRRDHRRIVHHRPEAEQGRRQGRLRAGPVQRDAEGRELAVGLGAGDPGRHQEHRRGAEVHHLGDLEGVHQPGGQGEGLGGGADRHAQVDLREPRVPEGRASFADAEKKAIDTRQPERQHRCPRARTSACSSRRSRSSRRSASRWASR